MKLPNLFHRDSRALTVGELMQTSVKRCSPEDSAHSAAQIMWDNDCGCVPVVDHDGRVVGMITDRDLCMAAYTQNRPLADIRVNSAMSKSVCSCAAHDNLASAQRLMQLAQVRRLPVTDREGRLMGVLSLGDIARHLGSHPAGATQVSGDELSATLASICRAPAPPADRTASARRGRPQ